MTASHLAVARERRKTAGRRCLGRAGARCAHLTRHRSQLCPEHREAR